MSASVVFDIETHILQRYTGQVRLQRLLAIVGIDPALAEAALAAAITETQQQRNVTRYQEIHQLGGSSYNLPPMDSKWIQEATHQNLLEQESLKAKLNMAQAHLNKDAIRSAHAALSEHFCKIGDVREAFSNELRAKDHSATLHQTATHAMQLLALALYSGNYDAIQDMVPRLEHSGRKTTESITAVALAKFAKGQYALAGASFRAAVMSEYPASEVSESWAHTVLAPEDLSMYAAVLTLLEDRNKAIELADHPAALEAAPILREILLHFHKHANYREASHLLESHVWPILRFDPYFQDKLGSTGKTHFTNIIQRIRMKAIGQFWKPYSNCPLSVMQESLGETVAGTVEELKSTVLQLLKNRRDVLPDNTRFDCRTNTLVRDAVLDDPVTSTAQKLHASSSRALDDTYSMIVRVACMENEIKVADPKKRRQNWNRVDSGHDEDAEDAMMVDADAMNPEDLY